MNSCNLVASLEKDTAGVQETVSCQGWLSKALMRVVALMAFFCSTHSFLCNCGDRMDRLDRHLTSEGCNTRSVIHMMAGMSTLTGPGIPTLTGPGAPVLIGSGTPTKTGSGMPMLTGSGTPILAGPWMPMLAGPGLLKDVCAYTDRPGAAHITWIKRSMQQLLV